MKWTTKRAAIGAILIPGLFLGTKGLELVSTIVGPWLPYISMPKSSDGLNPNLLGMWYAQYQYPDRGGIVSFEGTTEFFANKTYRTTGMLNVTFFIAAPRLPLAVTYDFNGNGEWQATDVELVTKLLNVKTRLVVTSRASNSRPLGMTTYAPNSDKTELEQGLLLAQSQRYDIRSTKKNQVVLETNGLYADSFLIDMKRTKKMYMR